MANPNLSKFQFFGSSPEELDTRAQASRSEESMTAAENNAAPWLNMAASHGRDAEGAVFDAQMEGGETFRERTNALGHLFRAEGSVNAARTARMAYEEEALAPLKDAHRIEKIVTDRTVAHKSMVGELEGTVNTSDSLHGAMGALSFETRSKLRPALMRDVVLRHGRN